ncbi:MAG: alpha/beta hydrolase, partial [Pseudomonadales bacterium]|nr:alpha/beta hydrolase [Pseudomonadales bacterium]
DAPAMVPSGPEDFSTYVDENRRRIRRVLEQVYFSREEFPFGPQYPLQKVIAMRAPFEIAPDPARCHTKADSPDRGFLLIHGLTDSPYLLSEFAAWLTDRFPCARIRSLLMPGHGTVPGDLLKVSLDDWQQAVRYGVQEFDGLVDELFLVGYSNGSALAVDYVQQHPQADSIKGLILLSPGLAAARKSIALTPFLKYLLPWVSRGEDRDPAKYDSIPTNAAAVFYRLTKQIVQPDLPDLDLPVFMAVSGDDTTVDADYAAAYYCEKLDVPGSRLIWYSSKATGARPQSSCPGIDVVEVARPELRYVSHSHVAISMPVDNEHYGLDSDYPVCSAYKDSAQQLAQCRTDNFNTVYGENNLRDEQRRYQGKLVRRATFNPFFAEMMSAVTCFVERNCSEQ